MNSDAIHRGTRALLSKQKAEGAWIGEVELNPGPSAQAVMLHAALKLPFPAKLAPKVSRYLVRTQNPDGGWSPHFGAESEVSLTIESYLALRLLGYASSDPVCVSVRDRIRKLGGIASANPWTQLYAGVLGIIPWEIVTRIPVEALLFSKIKLLPLNIDDLAYWVKVITVPMMLLGSVGPGVPIPLALELRQELEIPSQEIFAANTALLLKAVLKLFSRVSSIPIPKIREKAIRYAMEKIEQITEASGDFGGNTCTAVNVLLCLDRLGEADAPRFQNGLAAMMSYAIETEDEWRLQTCQSHIWDTGFALSALEKGTAPASAIAWLKDRQILSVKGPWARNVKADPAGWCFGNHHDLFPVTDCTALAVSALARHDSNFIFSENGKKAIRFLVEFQHASGGWSAYEKHQGGEWLDRLFQFKDIPNALSDLPKNDVSAKVLEALVLYRDVDARVVDPALERGRAYLLRTRMTSLTGEKIWKGNYGVNTLYGTAFSAKALRAIDGEPHGDWALDVTRYLLARQNRDGGWGEAEESYRSPPQWGRGESNPIQTAWALIGLIAASAATENAEAIQSAVTYLESTQQADGTWTTDEFLGTVFPEKVYFKYELYPVYFPLLALQAAKGKS